MERDCGVDLQGLERDLSRGVDGVALDCDSFIVKRGREHDFGSARVLSIPRLDLLESQGGLLLGGLEYESVFSLQGLKCIALKHLDMKTGKTLIVLEWLDHHCFWKGALQIDCEA